MDDPRKVDPSRRLLVNVGMLVCGDEWQRPLARLLLVDARLVRRWAAGTRPIPCDKVEHLVRLLEARIGQMQRALIEFYASHSSGCGGE